MPSLGSQPPPCSQYWQINTKVQSSCRRPARLCGSSPSEVLAPLVLTPQHLSDYCTLCSFPVFLGDMLFPPPLDSNISKKGGRRNLWISELLQTLLSCEAVMSMWLVNLSSCCFYSSSWDLNKKGFCCFIGGANSLKQAWILLTHF